MLASAALRARRGKHCEDVCRAPTTPITALSIAPKLTNQRTVDERDVKQVGITSFLQVVLIPVPITDLCTFAVSTLCSFRKAEEEKL